MAKRKYPSELKSRNIRANVDTYLMVIGLSRQLNITMAEALDKLIIGQDHKAPISPAQIPMPVTMAEAMPVTSARVRSTPVTMSFSREVKSVTNGHRQTD